MMLALRSHRMNRPPRPAPLTPAVQRRRQLFLAPTPAQRANWKGIYGKDGFNIIGNGISLPPYVTVAPSGKTDYQWTDNTTDSRALQKTTDDNRIAACWYSTSSFTLDFNFTDAVSHKLSLYFLDWDRSGRTQQVELLDSSSVLDSRSLNNFGEGTYLTWNVKGSVRVRITNSSESNALLMGAFFDAPGFPPINDNGSNPRTKIVFSDGQMHLQITGQPGQKFDIYTSTNLTDWINIATVSLTGATYDFVDNALATEHTLRFYRVTIAP